MNNFSLTKYYLAQYFATFFLGFSGIIGKIVGQHPFVIILFRTLFSFLGIFLFFGKKNKKEIFFFSKKAHLFFFITGGLLTFHWVAFFLGIQKSNASLGTLAFSIYPLFLTLLEPLFFSNKYSFYKSFLCLILVFGVYLLCSSFSFQSEVFLGICWGFFSGLLMAIFVLFNRYLSSKCPAKELSFFQSFYGCLISLPLVIFFTTWNISLQQLFLLFCLGFFCTSIPQFLMIFSLKKISAQAFGVINSLESVYTIIFSFFLLGEKLSIRNYLGGAIILSAIVAFSLHKTK